MTAYVGKKLIGILVLKVRKRLNLNGGFLQSLAMASIDPSVRLAISQPWKKYETRILQTYML
jgi:hypothetical protein